MTRDAKQQILRAFDALIEVESGVNFPRKNSRGGSSRCAVCMHSPAEMTPHHEQTVPGQFYYCPIGVAVRQLGVIIPNHDKRDEWLNEGIEDCAI